MHGASGTVTGWPYPNRARHIRSLSDEQRFRKYHFALDMCSFWDSTTGAVRAIARMKDPARRFAWGVMGFDAVVGAAHIATAIERGSDTTSQRKPDHDIYLCLGQIIHEHREGFGASLYSEAGLQSWRAFYMQLIVSLQPRRPDAAYFGIDVPRLAAALDMTQPELFELAEREAQRPGCQFGVLIRIAREEAGRRVRAHAMASVQAACVAAVGRELPADILSRLVE